MIIFNNRHTSLIRTLDPRFRIVAAAVFSVVVVLSERFAVLGVALAASLVAIALARIPVRGILARLADLNAFVLLLVAFLPPFVPGEPVFSVWRISFSAEGFRMAFLIALRANAIMVMAFSLLTTMEPAHLGAALSRLGCPAKLAHVLLFMVRYIEVIHREYHRLSTAMMLRAFRPRLDRHTLKTYGYLVGLLLIRSFERSDRIVEAMKCRGFRGRFYVVRRMRVARGDIAFAAVSVSVVFLLAWMEWL
jgi:cobalt/nickel transport system permease protein